MSELFVCDASAPVVETTSGKVRGYIFNGIATFHGIKYADAKRYHMPEPAKPWAGVRNAFDYGFVAPLMKPEEPKNGLFDPHQHWPENEDCQYINVWTPSADAAARKPVMVWIHGGGYTHGSSVASFACEGTNLSRFGDVVVVSFNHRLNILGCLDLSEYGKQYANAGNLVMADIVEALRWVRDNIANFGGDPGNVTIFGHSSGGAKVANLLQIPDADGLYHKAIIQTGIIPPALRTIKEDGLAVARALLDELDIAKENAAEVERVPLASLVAAWHRIAPALRAQGKKVEWGVHPNDYYLGDPLVVGLREHARQIPIMSGSTIGEFWALSTYPGKTAFDEAMLNERLKQKFGAYAGKLSALFARAYPDKDPSVLLATDSHARLYNLKFMDLCAKAGCEKLYSYLFAFEFPYFGGMPAWHGAELPFAFHNTKSVPICNKRGVTERLERQVASAWVQFARTGDPTNESLPAWPAYRTGREATMVLDEVSGVRYDYDRELVEWIEKTAPWFH